MSRSLTALYPLPFVQQAISSVSNFPQCIAKPFIGYFQVNRVMSVNLHVSFHISSASGFECVYPCQTKLRLVEFPNFLFAKSAVLQQYLVNGKKNLRESSGFFLFEIFSVDFSFKNDFLVDPNIKWSGHRLL